MHILSRDIYFCRMIFYIYIIYIYTHIYIIYIISLYYENKKKKKDDSGKRKKKSIFSRDAMSSYVTRDVACARRRRMSFIFFAWFFDRRHPRRPPPILLPKSFIFIRNNAHRTCVWTVLFFWSERAAERVACFPFVSGFDLCESVIPAISLRQNVEERGKRANESSNGTRIDISVV